MSEIRFVYITTSGKQEALALGRALVEARLAACVNILEGMTSLYWWQGEIEEAQETVLIAKTRGELMPALTAKIKSLHSYDCPCVISLPVAAGEGHVNYIDWIRAETRT